MTEAAAELVDVDRVNIWAFDDEGTTLRCMEHYDRSTGDHGAGRELSVEEFPAYFEALPRELVLAVDDARRDPRTAELEESYLAPQGIGALLDAPIRREDELVGVVCHEHVGGPRSWTDRQRYRAGLVADFIALALESRHRRTLEEKYRNLFDLSLDMIFLLDGETGRLLETNRQAAEALGCAEEELVGMSFRDLHPPEDRSGGEAAFEQVLESGDVRFLSHFVARDGERFPVEIVANRLELEGRTMVQALARDVSKWIDTQEALKASERRYRQLFEKNVAGVFRTTPKGEILNANKAFARMLGYGSPEELVEQKRGEVDTLFAEAQDRERLLERLRSQGAVENYEVRLQRKDGSTIWALESSSLETDPETGEEILTGTLINITERKRLQDELERMAYHDSLTGLANRRMLRTRAEAALDRARRKNQQVGLIYLDLERFKQVNDRLGHAAGDRALVEIAERLESAAREADTVARVGGDEFAVLLEEVEGEEGARQATERLTQELEPPIHLDDEALDLTARVGVAIFPDHGGDYDELLLAADAALYQHGEESPRGIQLSRPAAADQPANKLVLEQDVHQAVAREEFLLYYQPIVHGAGGTAEGAEALLRWRHPDRGLVAAGVFVHVAEHSSIIHSLDRWVLTESLGSVAEWRTSDARPDWVSVNLSAHSLRDPELGAFVADQLEARGVEPSHLVIEVTERTALRQPEQVRDTLRELRDLGVRVALDDFGTGHSALIHLQRFPVDFLKIDSVFTKSVDPEDSGAQGNLVEAIVQIGRTMGTRVIAGDVESEAQCARLRAAGCDLMQGYFLGEPVPAGEL